MNVMTEEEAKGKWCPFARAVFGIFSRSGDDSADSVALTSCNRAASKETDFTPSEESVDKITRCRASECMAWRWDPSTQRLEWWTGQDTPPANEGWERHGQVAPAWSRCQTPRGYCGLAGRPTP